MKKTGERKAGEASLIRNASVSAAIGIILTLLLLAAVSALTVTGLLSPEMSDEYVICCVIIGSAVSGARCARKMDRGVVVAGLAAAGIYLAVIFAGTIFTAKPGESGALTLKIIVAASAGGCFGGTLRLYRKTKKSKFRRKI